MSRHDVSAILTKYAQARTKRAQEVGDPLLDLIRAAPYDPNVSSREQLPPGIQVPETPGSAGITALGSGAGFAGGRFLESLLARIQTNRAFGLPANQWLSSAPISGQISPTVAQVRGPGGRATGTYTLGNTDLANRNLSQLFGVPPLTESVTNIRYNDPSGNPINAAPPGTQSISNDGKGSKGGSPSSFDPVARYIAGMGVRGGVPESQRFESLTADTVSGPRKPGGNPVVNSATVYPRQAAGGDFSQLFKPHVRQFWRGPVNAVPVGRGLSGAGRLAPVIGAGLGAWAANEASQGEGDPEFYRP